MPDETRDSPQLPPVHPGPPEDPYVSLETVQHLDRLLDDLRDVGAGIGQRLHEAEEISALQAAALQLISPANSIAASIRVMIREGYLVSAMILFRPLAERIATLCYLSQHEEALLLWRDGWPHGTRPSLKDRVSSMLPGASESIVDQLASAISRYNGLVHGDPAAAQQSLAQGPEGIGYVERDYLTPARANSIALETTVAVVVLIVQAREIFDLGV